MGAGVPLMLTCAPASVVFRRPSGPNVGLQVGARHELPSVKLVPKIAAMLPGASGEVPGAKLALFTTPLAFTVGVGGCAVKSLYFARKASPMKYSGGGLGPE